MKRLSMTALFALLVAVAGGGYWYWQKSGAQGQGEAKSESKAKGKGKRGSGPVSVSLIAVKRQAMPVIIDAVGTVESEHSVAIRPQTNGVLESVLFKEGDPVKQGQVLFRIDARPMVASVEQATAALARDQAQLEQAKAQEARLRPLADKDYITKSEYEVALTQSKALQATVEANRAALQQAKLQLGYASIVAPISGRTGSLSVRSGNLVTAGTGGAPLVVINSTRPILVTLSVPQRFLDAIRSAWGGGELKVEISPSPNTPAITQGALVFIDNTVNQQSGTIAVKARVKNEKEELWPGQFVAARIVLKVEEGALVLPEAAVLPGQDGPFVYVIKDGRAQVQNIVVDRQINDQIVISKGVTEGMEVVKDAPPTLAAGSQVVLGGSEGKSGKGAGKGGKGKGKDGKQAEPDAAAKDVSGKKVKP
jgi:multidrug efflux system membrane fusion protein